MSRARRGNLRQAGWVSDEEVQRRAASARGRLRRARGSWMQRGTRRDRKATRPLAIRTGNTSVMSKDSTWTMSVVPTLAPSMTARAGDEIDHAGGGERGRHQRRSRCSTGGIAVTPRPAAKARAGASDRPRAQQRGEGHVPKARMTPRLHHVNYPQDAGRSRRRRLMRTRVADIGPRFLPFFYCPRPLLTRAADQGAIGARRAPTTGERTDTHADRQRPMFLGNQLSRPATRSGGGSYLDEVAAAGYRGTELGPFGFPEGSGACCGPNWPARPDADRRDPRPHLRRPRDRAGPVATLRGSAPLLPDLGARHLVIMDESNWYPPGQRGRARRGRLAGADRDRARGAAADRGRIRAEGELPSACRHRRRVRAADRPAARGNRHRPLLRHRPSRLLGTGPARLHAQGLGGIAYIHLKNVDPAVRQRVLDGELSVEASYAAGVMAPLPDGRRRHPRGDAVPRGAGFDGPVVVEQDVADKPRNRPLQLATAQPRLLKASPEARAPGYTADVRSVCRS